MDREKDLEKKKPKSEEGGMRYSPRWKLLELKEILYENADENHGITMKDIQAKLMAACGTKPDVKTVYTDLNVLEDYGREKGLEILRPHGRETEYRLIRGENELSYIEIKMLIDTVQSSRFLTKKQSDTIISKLEQLCSVHERKTLNHKVIVANRSKSDNQHILYTMDSIHEAIEENKQIRFQYYGYNMRKEKEYHHYGKEYRVSPFAMIYRDGRYLLLAIPARDTRIRTYRVDRMVNVVVSHAERHNNEIFNSLNIEDYMNGLFGINVKKLVKVKLKCHKSLVDTILDRYGMDVPISILDEEHFSVTVAVDVNAEFIGWLVSLEKRVEVLEPKNVRNKICRSCGTPIVTHADVKEDFFIFQYLRMLYARLLSKACFGDDTDALMFFK